MDDVQALCAEIRDAVSESHAVADGEIGPDTPLLVSGLLDSLTIMRIVSRVEKRLGIAFPEEAVVAANFRTPAALWKAVGEVRGAGAGSVW
ncbi:acyl carrier protein [Nocardiopsis exhalans]|uniref:Acyl carrier protein n=1 Tax=Nocardiopsis exhalans TaxID=163604 RepID=A0ABY5DDC0_9ACTN|nr:acyl carrier protein [Nocardiopsis exhalans]USY22322.1 acyl carrier protein [Nocardiopsis exhalans]